MSENDQEKTEDPTQKRLDDARKKGQVAFSREVSNFFMLLSLTLIIAFFTPWMLKTASQELTKYLSLSHELEVSSAGFLNLSTMIFKDFMVIMGIPFIILVVAAIASSFIQNGFNISAQSITPKMEKISPIKGFKRLFSMRSLIEFIKGIIKITIVGMVAYFAVKDEMLQMYKIPQMEVGELMGYMDGLIVTILINCTIALFFIAILDFLYQKFEHLKQLRMTKQEIKEEYKQQEGDPHIKGKLKQMRMERARRRMMTAVPTADVVITNPTHYAVALKYETGQTGAPLIVAMGVDRVAEKIKELANENKVPIVRNPVLARALHSEGDLDKEIPFEHYQAVAEVISYVFKLKDKKA